MLKCLVLFCGLVVVGCERQSRLFSLEFEDRDISVDLDFSIPFITIPIKKSDPMSFSELPTININPASLALGGAVLLGTTVLLPLMMKGSTETGFGRYSRLLENPGLSAGDVFGFASELLADGRGVRGCALRLACWAAREHYDAPEVLGLIVKNKLISAIVNSTAIEDAMLSGRDGRSCDSYTPCPIQNRYMPMLVNRLSDFSKLVRKGTK